MLWKQQQKLHLLVVSIISRPNNLKEEFLLRHLNHVHKVQTHNILVLMRITAEQEKVRQPQQLGLRKTQILHQPSQYHPMNTPQYPQVSAAVLYRFGKNENKKKVVIAM